MLTVCPVCHTLFNVNRKRAVNYCQVRCRVQAHRQRRKTGGAPLPAVGVHQVAKYSRQGKAVEATMTTDAQRGADTLVTAISGAILAAEDLDLGPLDPDDVDQENALAELRRTLRALHQAADAAAGVVVATGGSQ
jgi:hypothetical protein